MSRRLLSLFLVVLIGPVGISTAQIDYLDLCKTAFRPVKDFAVYSMMIEGNYRVDGYQGSETRGQGFLGDPDEIIAVFDDQNVGPIVRGSTFPDSGSGHFTIQVIGDGLYTAAEESLLDGRTMELVLCDIYGQNLSQSMEAIPLGQFVFQAGPDVLHLEPRAHSKLDPITVPAGKSSSVASSNSHGTISTHFSVTVGIHGIPSDDPSGRLDIWYQRKENGEYKEDEIAEIMPSDTDEDGAAIYVIDLTVEDEAEERYLFMTSFSVDPRDGDPHFGYALAPIPFQPVASDFDFNGHLDDESQPWPLLLSHPPALTYYIFGSGLWSPAPPAQGGTDDLTVSKHGNFSKVRQIDLNDYVINPTGQPIHFEVKETDALTAEVDGSILELSSPDDWGGLDRLRIEATHDTGELTVREFSVLSVTSDMNYPDWTPPNAAEFQYYMQIIGAFDQDSGVTLEDGPIVGAFIDGVLSGVSDAIEVNGRVLMMISVYSNDPQAEIDLTGYTVARDELFSIPGTVSMQDGASFGTMGQPTDLGSVFTANETNDDVLPRNLDISSVFPNPTNDRVSIAFTTGESADVTFWLVDLLGRRQLVRKESLFLAGNHKVTIPLAYVAAGMYTIVVETKDGSASLPVALVK